MAKEILGENDPIFKHGTGGVSGIADGPYDDIHKLLRQNWYQTQTRLIGKNRINEIINGTSKMICETIGNQDRDNGIDPLHIFMNGTLNVVSGFSLGIIYEFNDPDFVQLAYFLEDFSKNMGHLYANKVITNITPTVILEQGWYRRLRRNLKPEFFQSSSNNHLFGEKGFFNYILRQIKNHRENLDISNPRDFMGKYFSNYKKFKYILDVLMIEADGNSDLGYPTIVWTIIALFMGATDALSHTLRWLVMVLTEYPEIQEKCYQEIQKSLKTEGEIIEEKCPYLRSVMLETMRWRPVSDTVPHISTEAVEIGGYHIPKNTPIQGW